jgi:hypothetical protein
MNLYAGNTKKSMSVPINNPDFKVNIAVQGTSACLIHAINTSLQGYFIVTLMGLAKRIRSKLHESTSEHLADFFKNVGHTIPVGVPLVRVSMV